MRHGKFGVQKEIEIKESEAFQENEGSSFGFSNAVQDFKLEWLSLSFQPSTERTKRLAKLEEPVEPPSTKALEPI